MKVVIMNCCTSGNCGTCHGVTPVGTPMRVVHSLHEIESERTQTIVKNWSAYAPEVRDATEEDRRSYALRGGRRFASAALLLLLSLLLGLGAPAKAETPEETRLIAAIRSVESGGNDRAIGDNGKARGPYQVHLGAWKDATAFGGVTWSYDLAFSETHARQVMKWYWQRYGAKTDEERARLWNGGPKWKSKRWATDGYWKKVADRLRCPHATHQLEGRNLPALPQGGVPYRGLYSPARGLS